MSSDTWSFPKIFEGMSGVLNLRRSGTISATALVAHLGRRTAVCEVDVLGPGAKLVAKALATYMLDSTAT